MARFGMSDEEYSDMVREAKADAEHERYSEDYQQTEWEFITNCWQELIEEFATTHELPFTLEFPVYPSTPYSTEPTPEILEERKNYDTQRDALQQVVLAYEPFTDWVKANKVAEIEESLNEAYANGAEDTSDSWRWR